MLNQDFWDSRYKDMTTGWDIGYASPPLIELTKSFNFDTKILIPGAGFGHEALKLHSLGYKDITVCDWSDAPLAKIKSQNPNIRCIQSDFFELEEEYDLILEQTFFCALDPVLRTKYVEKTHKLLVDNGRLCGVLFNINFEKQGPPFGGDKEEYYNLFNKYFDVIKMETCYNSIPPRANHELFINLIKKTN